ncbi:propanediol utilization protein, putative [Heliomicrobium modesticaldum Ice1]|uniref:Phosphate propanoyltransferase n=1 Tax=Heliobacterium modesticaldum (strain ATCC 51547 / Ice1) TaxID=498761 RepID=B0TFG3_HELMI|nr:phosphate propanoyltransferase [Heliomicrobium modesticaldum]ABZ83062.1 propanediol utilization protein, putative [Heliomicrobium modesticaldum Ice1]
MKYNVPVQVPVGVSNRHIHLSQADLEALFGAGYSLTEMKPLKQPGQYACKEVLIVAGPKGVIANVRVLGPTRKQTQVEVSRSDAFVLGLQPPVRDSGDLAGSPGCVLIGPKGSVILKEGLILASRHLHIHTTEAEALNLKDKDRITVAFGGERSVLFQNVLVRAGDAMALEFHLDTDEANACLLKSGEMAYIIEKCDPEAAEAPVAAALAAS